mmetsp:Transcript_37825/g.93669  ORF Transcript_37825/g.93669 Transcript_37825/m.93669 type:complete len:255 (+) Transcript_37825:976-1740(+)
MAVAPNDMFHARGSMAMDRSRGSMVGRNTNAKKINQRAAMKSQAYENVNARCHQRSRGFKGGRGGFAYLSFTFCLSSTMDAVFFVFACHLVAWCRCPTVCKSPRAALSGLAALAAPPPSPPPAAAAGDPKPDKTPFAMSIVLVILLVPPPTPSCPASAANRSSRSAPPMERAAVGVCCCCCWGGGGGLVAKVGDVFNVRKLASTDAAGPLLSPPSAPAPPSSPPAFFFSSRRFFIFLTHPLSPLPPRRCCRCCR